MEYKPKGIPLMKTRKMRSEKQYNLKASGAFVETFILEPYQSGALDGLKFAVKDNIDLAGKRTSYGSKSWSAHHRDAVYNAVCVDQLLWAGATCIGKTVADEFTYSLAGENHFFGTPLNPAAPDRVPGGSSSGSASAVACGLVDFALGTDSGGSVRVPASFCGVWGMRPTLHRISEAGVLPFMPGVSTVGAFANDMETLEKVMHILLCSPEKQPARVNRILLLKDAFSMADPPVKEAMGKVVSHLQSLGDITVSWIHFSDIAGDAFDLDQCNVQALRNLQSAEFNNTVGGWIEAVAPELSPDFRAAYQNARTFDRSGMQGALCLCENLFDKISSFTNPGDLFCYPTTPTPAPYRGALSRLENITDFYNRTMAVTSFAGVGRLPEISIPAADIAGVPIGVSLAAGYYQDEFLMNAARELFQTDKSL